MIASIIAGATMCACAELDIRVLGGMFIAGGVGALWAEGYSPVKIAKEAVEGIGALACFPYDYIRKKLGEYKK